MVIDTNFYSALDRGEQSAVETIKNVDNLSIPFCVIGELKYGFNFGKNTLQNNERLSRFLSSGRIEIIYPSPQTLDIYAEISIFCRKSGKVLSHNDLWIASLAIERDEQLVSYDKDFTVLRSRLGDKLVLL